MTPLYFSNHLPLAKGTPPRQRHKRITARTAKPGKRRDNTIQFLFNQTMANQIQRNHNVPFGNLALCCTFAVPNPLDQSVTLNGIYR